MIGVVVAAGKGERINGKCKPLLMVNGKKIIETIFYNMRFADCAKIYVIQNGDKIEKTYGYEYYGIEIEYIQQENQTGLLDAIKLMANIKTEEPMMVILGDVIYDGEDLSKLVKNYKEIKENIHAVVTYKKVENKEEIKKSYGFTSGEIMSIIEKPSDDDLDKLESWLGLGIWILKPEAFLFMKSGNFTETFNNYKNDVALFELKGKYYNINTEEELKNANNNFN